MIIQPTLNWELGWETYSITAMYQEVRLLENNREAQVGAKILQL